MMNGMSGTDFTTPPRCGFDITLSRPAAMPQAKLLCTFGASIPRLFVALAFVFMGYSFGPAQTVEIKYYPLPEVTFCKHCNGEFQTDGWKLKYRIENTSDRDIVVYGSRYARKSEFRFIYHFQNRNPHICEWQYVWGSSDGRCGWQCASKELSRRKILKPGEFVDYEMILPLMGISLPKRYTAYISTTSNSDATEIFSDPFVLEVPQLAGASSIPVLKTATSLCSPQINASASEIVSVRGLSLGTNEEEFNKLFPGVEVTELREGKYYYKTASVWNFDEDAYSIYVTFLNGKIGRIESRFKSLENTRSQPNFYQLISQKLNMPRYWERYQNGWEGFDFLIEVISNIDPTIYIATKEFIRFQDDLNAANLKMRK